jgi:hypothetical protein
MSKNNRAEKIQKKILAMQKVYRDLVLALDSVDRERRKLAKEMDVVSDQIKLKILKNKLQNL